MNLNLFLVAPEISLVVLALIVIVVDLLVRDKMVVISVALVGLIAPLALTIALFGQSTTAGNSLAVDWFSILFKLFFLGVAALGLLASIEYSHKFGKFRGEYFALVLTAVAGMMLLSASNELIMTYVALETMSISFYVLAGFLKDQKSSEASIKYLLLGALSSAFLLYGMALVYGLTGETSYAAIRSALPTIAGPNQGLLIMAVSFLIAGFGFKISAVPFQLWTPDVYEGAPTPVTALLSVGSKAAAFAALLRLFTIAFGQIPVDWGALWAVLAVLTMTVGNIGAMLQNNIKRMLAYSSIGQAGYILLGLASVSEIGRSSVVFYLLSYALTNLGAFAAIIGISGRINSDDIKDYAGMGKRAPLLAAALAFCLVSLTGIPPTAGFIAKLYVFSAAVQSLPIMFVIIAVLNSAASAFYYLRVVRAMYLTPAEDTSDVRATSPTNIAVVISSVAVLIVFFFSSYLISLADIAARTLR